MPVFSRLSLYIMAGISIALGLSVFVDILATIALSTLGILAVGFILDYRLTPGRDVLRVRRIVNPKLSLGDDNEIRLQLENERMQSVRGKITDNVPEEFQQRETEFKFNLKGGSNKEFTYFVKPKERGAYSFPSISLKVNGMMGLVNRIYHIRKEATVKVYPSYLQIKNYQLHSRRSNVDVLGRKQQRRYGEGREFESLREYTVNDEYRKINWKATARRGKPIVSQYQIERNQNVMILVDAGRMMRSASKGMSKLDYAINAALMLAYICIYKEDNVGLMVFNSQVETFLTPRRGKSQLNAINEHLYNVKFEFAEPNYREAFHFLKRKVSKRSLVILLTDLIDDRASQVLIHQFTKLYPRHLPLCVTLRDESLEQVAWSVPESPQEMLEMGVAQGLVEERMKALRFLQLNGVLTLDTLPKDLTAASINKYLDIKAKSLI